MRRTLAPKKQRQLFLTKVQALLLGLGAVQHDEEFILQTKIGSLTLSASENTVEGLGSVFGRFDDPTLARSLVDCNPYSGKWNHHYFSGWTVEMAIVEFSFHVQALLA